MPARSVPVAVCVGWPPVSAHWWLSHTMSTRLGGACRAMVASDPRFMSNEPSPSVTNTLRPGAASATPSPIDETHPIAPQV